MTGSECKNGFSDPNGYAAVVYLYAADLILEQTAGPSASNVTGELASAPSVSGTSDVAFQASDPGSGIYQAVFSIDGQVVQRSVIDGNGGRCRDVGETSDGLPAFLYTQPCPSSVSADVGFDTTKVMNGTHHLVVSVIDAAGNAAPVLDRAITIANPVPAGNAGSSASVGASSGGASPGQGPPNGSPASTQASLAVGWKSTKSTTLRSPFGHAQTIVGRLTGPGGTPIAGAQIDVQALPSYAGARAAAMPAPRTRADGSFALRVSAGVSSRTLRFDYRAHLGDPLPVATRTLTLVVSARVSLSIAPHTTSVGHSISFRGRLLGGPIPHDGKPLVLEARSRGGGWLEFNVVRANAHGLFHASYRFKFPGPAAYQFRVVCERESDFPFAAGFSNVVGVRER